MKTRVTSDENRKTPSSRVPEIVYTVLNIKRWPKELDRAVNIRAAQLEIPKYKLIERAVREFLKRL